MHKVGQKPSVKGRYWSSCRGTTAIVSVTWVDNGIDGMAIEVFCLSHGLARKESGPNRASSVTCPAVAPVFTLARLRSLTAGHVASFFDSPLFDPPEAWRPVLPRSGSKISSKRS
jgi:hypothetical protein